MSTPEPGRDERGRFALGNPGGPGGSHRRSHVLRRAAEEAIAPEHIAALIRKALRMGLEGDVAAMRIVFERTSGRPADVPPESGPMDIALPRLETAANCASATDRILQGMCAGTIDRETARVMLEGIQTRLRAIEATDLENRLTELEKAAQTVDLGARGNR